MTDTNCRKASCGDMMSAFVWLDQTERERRKTLDVIDLLREREHAG